jgi:hypothetical protein
MAIYLSVGLLKGRSSYRRILQPSKENIRNFKILHLLTYIIWWAIFALLNPDPDCESDPDPGTPLYQDPAQIRIHNTGSDI